MRKIVFLDLEDTVLDDFSKGWHAKAVNHPAVSRFIAKEAPDEVRIFSFAISNARDAVRFDDYFKAWLENALNIKITSGDKLFTTQQLLTLCTQSGTFYDTETECMLFHGKLLGFVQFIRLSEEFVDCETILVDDAIGEPMMVELPKRNVKIRLVNVADLP